MRNKLILSSEMMLHKDYACKGSVAKWKSLVVSLEELGAKMINSSEVSLALNLSNDATEYIHICLVYTATKCKARCVNADTVCSYPALATDMSLNVLGSCSTSLFSSIFLY
jgi:hypothetical protein